jgi:cell division protease FtsH
MQEQKNPRKPLIYYAVLAFVVLMLLNAFVFPQLLESKVEETDYGTFLQKLENGEIDKVEIDENILYYSTLSEGEDKIYSTGAMPDGDLTNRLFDAGVVFTKVVPQETSPIMSFILTWVVPIAIFLLLGRFLTSAMQKRMGGNAMSFGKSNAKIYVQAKTGKTFADVAGQEEAKEALTEIVDFLHNPDKYARIGARLPKGALLVGPPGTGKTLLAQAVAGEAKVPFFSISGSEFVEMFVGMGAAKVRDLFKQATEKAPCIVFIDEIDTIGKKRDGKGMVGGNDEREQTLNQLLTEMDGFDGKKGVVILAATNRPDSLDKALLRPGRFDRRIPVELPDLQGREAILKVHARNVKVDPNVDCNSIARATAGASGADLANTINEAALRAVKMGRDLVSQEDLEESVEVVLAGYQRKNVTIQPREKEIIAYHEIGHALVAAMQSDSAPVHKITIVPRTSGALGYTMQIAEDEKFLMSKEEIYNKIVTFTGGRAAEELIFNTMTSGAANDIEQATKLARAMITRFGMSAQFDMMALETSGNSYLGDDTTLLVSAETAAGIDAEVLATIRTAHQKAAQILSDNLPKMHELARYLLDRETITGEEFMNILNRQEPEQADFSNEQSDEPSDEEKAG